MAAPARHFYVPEPDARPGSIRYTVCGKPRHKVYLADDPGQVTCKFCLKTHAYAEHLYTSYYNKESRHVD